MSVPDASQQTVTVPDDHNRLVVHLQRHSCVSSAGHRSSFDRGADPARPLAGASWVRWIVGA